MDLNAVRVRLHVAVSDREHGVHFYLLSALDFAVNLVPAFVDFGANLIGAQFVEFNNPAAGVRQKRS